MHQSTWRSEDGQLLRSLREQAGIDEHTFARANTLSLSQLRELEDGGDSSFYNPAIKRSTGVKLLKKLGHERAPTPEPQLASQALQVPHPTPQTLTDPEAVSTAHPPLQASAPTRTAARVRLPLLWLGLILLAALLWLMIPSWTPQPTALPSTPLALSVAAPAPAEPAAPPMTADPQPLEEKPSAEAAPTLSCDWQHRGNSYAHTPSQPLKPDHYVYLEALADIELCVLDSQNQQTQLQLKAGTVKSVYGAAPFLVQSRNWQNLKLFFQGRRVQANLQDMQHLLLNSQSF